MLHSKSLLFLPLSALLACNDQGVTAFNANPEAVITSHADGDVVLEGYSVQLWGVVEDPDHGATELITIWYAGDEEICAASPADDDGFTSCDTALLADGGEIVLEVRDPQDAAGSASVSLVVEPTETPQASIVSPVQGGVYYSDQLVTFEGLVSDGEDDPEQLTVSWNSGLDGTLGLEAVPDSDGSVVGASHLSEGEHFLTLRVEDSTGKTGSDNVTIEVGPPNSAPSCGITEPADGAVGEQGQQVVFRATVDDVDVGEDWLSVTWISDSDGTLGSSTPTSSGEVVFSTSDLSVATHAISMTVADEVGATCTDLILFTVGTAPSLSIDSPGDGEVLGEGQAISFAARATDNEDSPTELALSWHSSLDGEFSTQGADSTGLAQHTADDLTVGDHTLTVTATDSDGLYTQALVLFTVNGSPSTPGLSLSPDPAYTDDDLLVSIDTPSSDPEGDSINYGYAWYREGTLSSASSSETLPASATARGETWTVRVTPSDGISDGAHAEVAVLIDNSVPTIAAASIAPDPAYAGDSMACSWSGFSDADGDADASTIAWTLNGASAGSGSTLGSAVVGGNLVACTVTPHDGIEAGSPVSASLWIENTPPELASVSLSPDPAYEGDTLSCSPGAISDADGTTSFSYAYAWEVDGAALTITTATLDASHFSKGEAVTCTVTPHDGTDPGTPIPSNSVVIANTPPSIATVTISPNPATVTDTLSCSWAGYADADGDPDASTALWSVDGAAMGSGTSFGGSFARGDTVTCTVTPHDGTDAGTALSDSVTIDNSPPEVITVALSPSSPTTDVTVGAAVTSTDDDGDSVGLSYSWSVDGTVVAETGSSLDGGTWFDKGQQIELTVTPYDSAGVGVPGSTGPITVLNTPPGAPSVSIAPTEPVEGVDDLVCAIDADSSDDDGDPITYTFSWTVDGAGYSGSTSTTAHSGDTVPASATAAEELWECTVIPDDTEDDGASAMASVTVHADSYGPDVWVAGFCSDNVIVVDVTADTISEAFGTSGGLPRGIALDEDGQVYLGMRSGSQGVERYTQAGSKVDTFVSGPIGSYGPGLLDIHDGQLIVAGDVASSGSTYIYDIASGSLVDSFQHSSISTVISAEGDDDVVYTTGYWTNQLVAWDTSSGSASGSMLTSDTYTSRTMGLTVGHDGRLYICDGGANYIRAWSTSGSYGGTWANLGAAQRDIIYDEVSDTYFATVGDAVYQLDTSGSVLDSWSHSSLSCAYGIEVWYEG